MASWASHECRIAQVALVYLIDTKVFANTIVQWTLFFVSGLIGAMQRAASTANA